MPICLICDWPIAPEVPQSLHHLTPKLRAGKGGPVVVLHHVCHREIHATLGKPNWRGTPAPSAPCAVIRILRNSSHGSRRQTPALRIETGRTAPQGAALNPD